jgi:NADP-dependent 3-hydroxy acid dehydrogenase YdfG
MFHIPTRQLGLACPGRIGQGSDLAARQISPLRRAKYSMPVSLKDQIVLITGSSSGFGADAARLVAKEGCQVVLAARRIDRLQALKEQIENEGGHTLAVPVDVANYADIHNMVQSVLDIYGHVDILFNNAGFGRLDWLEQLDPARDIETQIDVNLSGVIETTRAVLPHMIERRRGHIINMASVAGWIAAPTFTVYAATKYGVRGFTDALRREVAPLGIKVSGIYPGPAATEFGEHTGRNIALQDLRGLSWINMTSESVARRVIEVAKHPRRTSIFPWWFRIAIWGNDNTPWLVDGILYLFTRRYHK